MTDDKRHVIQINLVVLEKNDPQNIDIMVLRYFKGDNTVFF